MCQMPGQNNGVHLSSHVQLSFGDYLLDDESTDSALLEFHPMAELELETLFVLLAMLESPKVEMDAATLHDRVQAVDLEFTSSILERLEMGGWTTTRWELYDITAQVGGGRLFYRFTTAGCATAYALLDPLKDRLFGHLARLLNFRLDYMFPELGPESA